MTSQSKLSSFEIVVCDAGWRDWFYLVFNSSCGHTGISEFTESHGPKIGLIASIHETKLPQCRTNHQITPTAK